MADDGSNLQIRVAREDDPGVVAAQMNGSNPVSQKVGRECSEHEQALKRFAKSLSRFNQIATYLGRMTAIWASFVLLGGFGNTLAARDFWFSTAVLLLNKIKLLSRDYAVELQRQATSGLHMANAEIDSTLKELSSMLWRTHKSRRDTEDAANSRKPEQQSPQLFSARAAMIMFFFLFKSIAAALFMWQTFSVPARVLVAAGQEANTTVARNKKYSLVLFYVLVSLEGIVFFAGDCFYLYKVFNRKLLQKMSEQLGFGRSDVVPAQEFVIDCIHSSDPERDMVTLAVDLLASDLQDKQLVGVRILETFATNGKLSSEVLINIGANLKVLQTLVEMLNWRGPEGKAIRRSAARVLSKLAKEKENARLLASIPDSMKSISSLLHREREGSNDEEKMDEEADEINELGLLILKELVLDRDVCGKIGKMNGLLQKLVVLTQVKEGRWLEESAARVKERSLELLRLLTSTAGTTGEILRREIPEIDLMIINIREILTYGEKYPVLQKRGIEVLANLAEEELARERIGSTSKVLEELQKIFFRKDFPNGQEDLRAHAGEVIAKLALESKTNCQRILKLNIKEGIMGALQDKSLCLSAAKILQNLCIYSKANSSSKLKELVTSPAVFRTIIDGEEELQEVMVGVAAYGVKSIKADEWSAICQLAGMEEATLAVSLTDILRRHKDDILMEHASTCSFVVELAVWMMRRDSTNVNTFKELGLKEELEDILETTSEMEEAIKLLS